MYAARNKYSMGTPRYLYWLSLLLLIVGGRMLIDPSNRSIGETIQIYITLAAFELYMWLLLVPARWQWRKKGWVRMSSVPACLPSSYRGPCYARFFRGRLSM